MSHEDIPYAFVLITTPEQAARLNRFKGPAPLEDAIGGDDVGTRSYYRPEGGKFSGRFRRSDIDMLPTWWNNRERHRNKEDGPAIQGPTRDSWIEEGFILYRINKDGQVWVPSASTLAKREAIKQRKA